MVSATNITASGNISGSATTRIDSQDLFLTRTLNTPMIESTDDLAIDVGGDITLDAAGDDIFFKDNGTTRFTFNLDTAPSIDVAGSFEIDSSGDITLDAAGDDIFFKDAGSTRFTFNLDSTPEIDVTGDFTLDGSGDIKLDSATNVVDLVGNVTASGNISLMHNLSASSANGTHTLGGKLGVGAEQEHLGVFSVNYGSGTDLTGSLTSVGDGFGKVVKFGNSTTLAGRIYHLNSSGGWSICGEVGSVSSSLLAVALGTNSTTDGMLLEGFVNGVGQDVSPTCGQAVHCNSAARFQMAAPSDAGDVVRIIGYVVGVGTTHYYFKPSSTYVVVS